MEELRFDPAEHKYFVGKREVPSVTTILKEEGFIDSAWFTESGRQRGSYVHLAVHYHDMNELDEDSLDDTIRPYVEAWKRFKVDTGIVIIESEVPILDPLKRYAGTPDKIVMLDDKQSVLDLKTGIVSPWVRLQLCAYGEAKGIYRRFAVQLCDDGKYKVHQYIDRQDFGVWNAVLAVYFWKMNELKRRG
jgi:hypothetical protein